MRRFAEHWTPKGRAVVAEDRGRVVGVASYAMTRQRYAYGVTLEIHPDYRAQGLGDRLHGARVMDAKARGASHFIGATTNPAMAKILEAWGGLKVPVKDDEGKDCYVLRLDVD